MEITKKQIKAIYALANARDIDNEFLHDIVDSSFEKTSIKALTAKEAAQLIDLLDGKKTSKNYAKRYDKDGRNETQALRRKIYMLTKELGWESDVNRIYGFCKKVTGVERLEWLSRYQCSIVIEGLKKIIEKQKKAE